MSRNTGKQGRAWIGISGYDYKPWRGSFYPDDIPARKGLMDCLRAPAGR